MRPDVLATKLAALTHRIERARSELPGTATTFLGDLRAQELVSFNLLLAVQGALDIAAHLVAEGGWGVPGTSREHFELLADHGVIPQDLAVRLAGCAGARNLVAHHYGRLDLERLFRELPGGLESLAEFAVVMAGRPESS